MENVCRVCRDGSVTLVDIFSGLNDNDRDQEKNLAYVLSQCANCQVSRDDLLPKQICLSCVLAAQNAFRFKKTCEQSYEHFCQLLEMGRQRQLKNQAAERRVNDYDVHMAGGLHVIDVSCIKVEPGADLQEDAQQENLAMSIPSSEEQDNRINEVFPHVCQYCTKGFRGKFELNNHIRSRHTGERPFKCPHCPKDFSVRIYLRNHIRVHTGERPYKCPHCPNAFTLPNSLKAHIRRHDNSHRLFSRKPFRCDCCAASFREHYGLRRHKQLKHRIGDIMTKAKATQRLSQRANERPLPSSTNRSEPGNSNAVLHNWGAQEDLLEVIKDLTGVSSPQAKNQSQQQDTYFCEICVKKFQYRYAYTNHMRIHMRRPYRCPHPNCSKAFQTDINLRKHKLFHATDWPYQCKKCGKGFYKAYQLRTHMHVHSDEKPFECPQCLQRFKTKLSLNRHISKIHSEDAQAIPPQDGQTKDQKEIKTEVFEKNPPHEFHEEQILPDDGQMACHICGKQFASTSNLNRHISGHTGFECPYCSRTYTQSYNLKSHIAHYHKQAQNLNGSAEMPAKQQKPKRIEKAKMTKTKSKSSGGTSYRCKWCPIAFREHQKMMLHMQQKHKKRLMQSSSQEEAKKDATSEINKEINEEPTKVDDDLPKDGKKSHKCRVCKKMFSQRLRFIQHIHTHKPPLNCTECPKQFERYSQLRMHVRLHNGVRFQCAHCANSYSRRDNLVKHMRKHSNVKVFDQGTDITDTEPVEDELLRQTQSNFNCEVCSKSFYYEYNLRMHKLMKHGINKEEEEEEEETVDDQHIDFGFEQEKYLKFRNRPRAGAYEELEDDDSDVEKHTINERKTIPNPQLIINQKMLRSQKAETFSNIGDKSHACPYCKKRYVRKESLTIHMRGHTGERPYKCSYCEKCFSSNNSYKRHLRGHTGDLFRCDKCPKVFKTRSELRFHINRNHSDCKVEPIVLTKHLIVRLKRIKLPETVKLEPIDLFA